MEIISFLKYVNRLKTPTPTPFPYRSYEQKTDIMSKELTDYIKKSNEESIQRMVSKYTNFNGLLPIRMSEKFSLTPFFSRGTNYENGYSKNYLFYLGLFTGSCLFVLWKRQK